MVSATLRARNGYNSADSVAGVAGQSNEHWQHRNGHSRFNPNCYDATFGTPDYFSFMAMSMVAFTVVFTTAFTGMSVVWDKRLGFMNKVLSTPVSRSAIIMSKVLVSKRTGNIPSSHSNRQ